MKQNLILSITTLLFLFTGIPLANGQAYREAREKLRFDTPPPFIAEQIEAASAAPASERIQIATDWLEAFIEWSDEGRAGHSLDDAIRVVNPLLLETESRQLQTKAKADGIDSLLAQRPTLPILFNTVYARNPRIQSASHAWNATLNRYEQSLYLEGVQRQYNAFTKRLDLMTSDMSGTAQRIASEFPFPGLTALRGDIVRADIHLAELEFAKTARDVLTETAILANELAYLYRAVAITEENVDLLRQTLEVTSTQFEAGAASYIYVLQTRIELDRLRTALETMRDRRQSTRAALNALMDRSPNAPLGKPALPESIQAPTLETATRIALENRQEIQTAKRMLHRMERMIAMSKKMERPDATVGASYFEDRSGLRVSSMRDSPAFNSQPRLMTRPWFGERESFIQEMIGRKEAIRAKVHDEENQTQALVENAYADLNSALRELALYRDSLLLDAKQTLTVSEAEYRSARIQYNDYLEALRAWLEINLNYHSARRDAGIALARLEAALGGSSRP